MLPRCERGWALDMAHSSQFGHSESRGPPAPCLGKRSRSSTTVMTAANELQGAVPAPAAKSRDNAGRRGVGCRHQKLRKVLFSASGTRRIRKGPSRQPCGSVLWASSSLSDPPGTHKPSHARESAVTATPCQADVDNHPIPADSVLGAPNARGAGGVNASILSGCPSGCRAFAAQRRVAGRKRVAGRAIVHREPMAPLPQR